MIALYDHIQELRAELGNCIMTRRERANAHAELARNLAQQTRLERELDLALEALSREEER